MAVSDLTYAGLQSSITDWMARPDLTVAQVKDAIFLFETEINRRLATREMETSDTLTTTLGSASLPADYDSWRGLTWNGQTAAELDYAHPTVFHATFTTADQDIPAWFTIEGNSIKTRPIDDTADAFTLRYCQKVPNLSDSAQTNWLLLAHPDLYLAGCLSYGFAYVRDPDAAQTYKGIMEEKIQQLKDLNERSKAPAELRTVGWVA